MPFNFSEAIELACHLAACRPPSSGGTGGSIKSRDLAVGKDGTVRHRASGAEVGRIGTGWAKDGKFTGNHYGSMRGTNLGEGSKSTMVSRIAKDLNNRPGALAEHQATAKARKIARTKSASDTDVRISKDEAIGAIKVHGAPLGNYEHYQTGNSPMMHRAKMHDGTSLSSKTLGGLKKRVVAHHNKSLTASASPELVLVAAIEFATERNMIEDAVEFACYARACAPPPVGTGGSRGARAVSRARRAADISARGKSARAYHEARQRGDKRGMGSALEGYRKARNRVADNITKDKTRIIDRKTAAEKKVSAGRFTDKATSQRALKRAVTTASQRKEPGYTREGLRPKHMRPKGKKVKQRADGLIPGQRASWDQIGSRY